MLTPYFELSQTDKEIVLFIRAPMANIAETELNVDEEVVIFYSSPYYLRIHLPGKVQDDPPGSFDCDSGEFKFVLQKCTEGEYFQDLDLIGKLLNPPRPVKRPDIRLCNEAGESSESECDDNEWLLTQEPFQMLPVEGPKYGFADKCQGLTSQLRTEFFEILDITDNQNSDKREWTKQRENEEISRFSEDHYLADFMDPTPLKELIEFVPIYQTFINNSLTVELSPSEKDYLKNLGNKDYLLDGNEKRKALFSLVDILYAYAYNHRTTLGENTVESAWTVNKLSSTLSWLESFSSIRDVKLSSMRRSLVYPLFRHWDLSTAVVQDTVTILKLGKRQILKNLIEIHSMFNASEPRYLLNQFYITDYCIWIQKVSDKTIGKLVEAYEQVQVCKADMEMDLEELEAAAVMVQEEEVELLLAAEMRRMALSRDRCDTGSDVSSSDYQEESDVTDNENSSSESGSSPMDSDDLTEGEEELIK